MKPKAETFFIAIDDSEESGDQSKEKRGKKEDEMKGTTPAWGRLAIVLDRTPGDEEALGDEEKNEGNRDHDRKGPPLILEKTQGTEEDQRRG
jgi:hypothetical protein